MRDEPETCPLSQNQMLTAEEIQTLRELADTGGRRTITLPGTDNAFVGLVTAGLVSRRFNSLETAEYTIEEAGLRWLDMNPNG